MAIKVSQATIDKIKAMGMTKALKGAGAASPEMREGIKRMYGAKRFNAAVSSTKPYASRPASKSADAARSSATKVSKPVAKTADAARAAATKTTSAKPAPKKVNTTSNPITALHNAVSPYGNKDQKYVSGIKPGATRKSVPGKPSIGEQISGVFSGKSTSLRANNGMTAAQVAAENKRRAAAVAAAKAKKNK